jgi:hypothetical protein
MEKAGRDEKDYRFTEGPGRNELANSLLGYDMSLVRVTVEGIGLVYFIVDGADRVGLTNVMFRFRGRAKTIGRDREERYVHGEYDVLSRPGMLTIEAAST